MTRTLLPAAIACLLAYGPPILADNWPAWRGPTGQGICEETDLPLSWSATERVRWKLPLPGPGNSTPIVWKGKLFLTQATAGGAMRWTWCVDSKSALFLDNQRCHVSFCLFEPLKTCDNCPRRGKQFHFLSGHAKSF